jgi:hypothetical protein
MRRTRLAIILVPFGVALALILGFAAIRATSGRFPIAHSSSSPPTPSGPSCLWDLSHDQRLVNVSWPCGYKDDVLQVGGPLQVTLRLPDGRMISANVGLLQVFRSGDRVHIIELWFPAEDLASARARARELMLTWHLSNKKSDESLQRWYANRCADPESAHDPNGADWEGACDDTHGAVVIGVRIRSTFAYPSTWTVRWTVGFAQPTSRPGAVNETQVLE